MNDGNGARFVPTSEAERDEFTQQWCRRCARDAPMNSGKAAEDCRPHELCPLLTAALAFEPRYPKEWRRGDDGGRCTAFVPVGQPAPPLGRCPFTRDLLDP